MHQFFQCFAVHDQAEYAIILAFVMTVDAAGDDGLLFHGMDVAEPA